MAVNIVTPGIKQQRCKVSPIATPSVTCGKPGHPYFMDCANSHKGVRWLCKHHHKEAQDQYGGILCRKCWDNENQRVYLKLRLATAEEVDKYG